MPLNAEKRQEQYRAIYEAVCKPSRIFKNDIAELLHVRPSTVSSKLRETLEQGGIPKPQIRRQSCELFLEKEGETHENYSREAPKRLQIHL